MSNKEALLKHLKVLYIEDDVDVREQMHFFLKKRVGQLIVSENGVDGLIAFKHHQPDLILSDLQMPKMDGLTMAREVRKISQVPIVITTAFSEKEMILKAVDIGISGYVIKPIDRDQLLETLESVAVNILRSKGQLLLVRGQKLSVSEKLHREELLKNQFAKIIKDTSGKGPQVVKTIIFADEIMVEVQGTLTKYEQYLVNASENEASVRYNRWLYYLQLEPMFNEVFSKVMGEIYALNNIEINISNDHHFLNFKMIN